MKQLGNIFNIDEFFPTPKELVEKMLSTVDLTKINSILEPSAGKGDIIKVLSEKSNEFCRSFSVDCIELNDNLRAVLKASFEDEKRLYLHIVHDDFLTYKTFKNYDLIVMNPPFSNGADHLLKALDMQSQGGRIVCLLNANSIKNPCTKARKVLVDKLEKYNANIEFIENAFSNAERKTNVEVALITVNIPKVQKESDIFKKIKKAEEYEETDFSCQALEVTDYIKAIVHKYNFEVQLGIELINEYKLLEPYIQTNFRSDNEKKSYSSDPILELRINNKSNYFNFYDEPLSVNSYLREVRLKYWNTLLMNPKITGKLTTNMLREYRSQIDKFADYDFSEFNINTLVVEINSKVKQGIEEEIFKLFDNLTVDHAHWEECQNNVHYYDGWVTNKAHKIDKRVILPCYGVFESWDNRPRTYQAKEMLEDLERVLNFLDGNMTKEVDLEDTIDSYFRENKTKNIPLKYFNVSFYKKGTMHLTFTCPKLIERFNIYVALNKSWLPPSYGKKQYDNMTDKERQVIDSFQGKNNYQKIINDSNFYLSPVANNTLYLHD